MTRLRVACVGTGFIAEKHLRALSGMADVEVVAVADTQPDRAEQVATRYDARPYGDGLALLQTEELDAVWLCVPPFAHGALEATAITRGLPLFVEKPLALDLPAAQEVADRLAGTGLTTAVGYHWRHLDVVRRGAELLAETPAQLVTGYWWDKTPRVPWWPQRAHSGGQVIEQTTHIFDLARHLAGEVETVIAAERAAPDGPEDVPLAASSLLRFVSGAVGGISSARPGWAAPGRAARRRGWPRSRGLRAQPDRPRAPRGHGRRRGGAAVRDGPDRRRGPGVRRRPARPVVPYPRPLPGGAAHARTPWPAPRTAPPGRGRQCASPGRALVTERPVRSITVPGPGRTVVIDDVEPEPGPGQAWVTTEWSGISAGTEVALVRGTDPQHRLCWDPDLRAFGVGALADYPKRGLGYMEVGRVTESRTDAMAVGSRVAMAYGHRTGACVDPARTTVIPVPDDLAPLLASTWPRWTRSASTACCTPRWRSRGRRPRSTPASGTGTCWSRAPASSAC